MGSCEGIFELKDCKCEIFIKFKESGEDTAKILATIQIVSGKNIANTLTKRGSKSYIKYEEKTFEAVFFKVKLAIANGGWPDKILDLDYEPGTTFKPITW